MVIRVISSYVRTHRSQVAFLAILVSLYLLITFTSNTAFFSYSEQIDPQDYKLIVKYKGITIRSTDDTALGQLHITATKDFIDIAPPFLLEKQPQNISFVDYDVIRSASIRERFRQTAAGFAQDGNYYFFFREKEIATQSVYAQSMYTQYFWSVLAHEWMHVRQFHENKTPQLFDALLWNEDSRFEYNYRRKLGWVDLPFQSAWLFNPFLPPSELTEKQTDYGKHDSEEDQAEIAEHYLLGRDNYLSQRRVDWIVSELSQAEDGSGDEDTLPKALVMAPEPPKYFRFGSSSPYLTQLFSPELFQDAEARCGKVTYNAYYSTGDAETTQKFVTDYFESFYKPRGYLPTPVEMDEPLPGDDTFSLWRKGDKQAAIYLTMWGKTRIISIVTGTSCLTVN